MTMPMNRFVRSLELSAKAVDGMISGWNDLDDDLQENYRDTIEWLLANAGERLDAARGNHECFSRIVAAWTSLHRRREDLAALGFHVPGDGASRTVLDFSLCDGEHDQALCA